MIYFHVILHPTVHIYDFHIFITTSSSFHGFITNKFNNLFPVGLVEHCTGIAEVKGSNPVQAWIFFCLLFTNAKVVSITTMIYFHLHFQWSNNNNNNTYIVPISILLFSSALMKHLWSILHPTVHTYDFHIFMTLWSSFHGFIMNQFNNLLAVGLLAQLTERCTGIAKAKGSSLVQAWIFFRLSFRNCKSCVYNCNDLLSYNTIN